MSRKRESPAAVADTAGTLSGPAVTLTHDGSVVLTAASREALFRQLDEMKEELPGYPLAAGAVGHTDRGQYVMRVDIV